jgi:hypothetical protein
MNSVISWIAAEADGTENEAILPPGRKPPQSVKRLARNAVETRGLPVHQFPGKLGESQAPLPTLAARNAAKMDQSLEEADSQVSQNQRDPSTGSELALGQSIFADDCRLVSLGEEEFGGEAQLADEYERRVYRNRTVSMLRRYMRYSLETGKLPSLLGSEFFRTRIRASATVTLEDRIIFVHDMEKCLEQLDGFAQLLIARNILQEHDCENTARLLHCNEKTVRRLMPMALDRLGELLLERGLMETLTAGTKKSCQEGEETEFALSDWEDDENKF